VSEEKKPEEVYSYKSWGEDGMTHVVITLSFHRDLTKNDKNVIYDAGEKIIKELNKETRLIGPKYIEIKKKWMKDAQVAFLEAGIHPIFVVEIPNEYCGPECCPHMPWFRITTTFGVLKVGWRKRVIHLEWTDSLVKTRADDLFAGEDVTKEDRMIHAWGYEKLTEYLRKLKREFDERVGSVIVMD
jgi:hypothetical protein